jgi:hypothetical protein
MVTNLQMKLTAAREPHGQVAAKIGDARALFAGGPERALWNTMRALDRPTPRYFSDHTANSFPLGSVK